MLVRITESNLPQAFEFIGDPGWIRTSDLQLRRLLLRACAAPPELFKLMIPMPKASPPGGDVQKNWGPQIAAAAAAKFS